MLRPAIFWLFQFGGWGLWTALAGKTDMVRAP
jgi:hypothetical protein